MAAIVAVLARYFLSCQNKGEKASNKHHLH